MAKNIFYKILISIDEILAGHYKNFKEYKKTGMEKLISDSELKLKQKINGVNDMYKIWVCEK